MRRILFLCTANKLRSPTAEQVFSQYPNLEVASAGLGNDAVEQLTAEHLEGVDTIFVMEKAHRNKLSKKFKQYIGNAKVICLNIPDEYAYMDPELITLLKTRVGPHLR